MKLTVLKEKQVLREKWVLGLQKRVPIEKIALKKGYKKSSF